MKKITHFRISFFLILGFFANAQDIVWTGNAANNDFFDEGNWKNSVTNVPPITGTIDAGVAINLPLQLNTVTTVITANGMINLGTGSLVIDKAKLTAQSLSGGSISVKGDGYKHKILLCA